VTSSPRLSPVSASKPRCLVLDAGPVIGLHELGIWVPFVNRYEVVMPQIVVDDEAFFHSADAATGQRKIIDLSSDVAAGRVTVASVDLETVARVAKRFSAAIELHAGELEALTILTVVPGFEEHVFCTGDGAAIQAACLLGLAERCESVEALLDFAGLRRQVPWHLSKRFMDEHKREGAVRAVTGFGRSE
jgi:hypothetical protein